MRTATDDSAQLQPASKSETSVQPDHGVGEHVGIIEEYVEYLNDNRHTNSKGKLCLCDPFF